VIVKEGVNKSNPNPLLLVTPIKCVNNVACLLKARIAESEERSITRLRNSKHHTSAATVMHATEEWWEVVFIFKTTRLSR
jgi:hypothetical protein